MPTTCSKTMLVPTLKSFPSLTAKETGEGESYHFNFQVREDDPLNLHCLRDPPEIMV